MILIFCVDDNFGLMFNKRRQSRDSVVIEDIKNCFTGKKICISPYSEKLFKEAGVDYTICESFENQDEICFVEDKYTRDLLKKADSVVIYHWNRLYPSDVKLDYQIIVDNFKLAEALTFKGSSHNEIERERYTR